MPVQMLKYVDDEGRGLNVAPESEIVERIRKEVEAEVF